MPKYTQPGQSAAPEITFGTPLFNSQLAGTGTYTPGQAVKAAETDDRPYSSTGKLSLNLLDIDQNARENPAIQDQGGLFTGFFGGVGNTFGEPGREAGEMLGRIIEAPLGLLGGAMAGIGGVGIGVREPGIPEGEEINPAFADLSIIDQGGKITLGSLAQSGLGMFGLLGRVVERAYAGSGFRTLSPDIQQRVDSGEITREMAADLMVAKGAGYTDDLISNIGLSILLDPLTWLTLGVGAIGKGASATTKVLGGLEKSGALSGFLDDAGRLTAGAARRAYYEAETPLTRLGRLEAFGLHTAGRVSTLTPDSAFVRVANQVTRITDPLKLFGGGTIGKRTADHVMAGATEGLIASLGPRVVDRVHGAFEALEPGLGARLDKALAVATTNITNRWIADEYISDALRVAGDDVDAAVQIVGGTDGVGLTPNELVRVTLANKGVDRSIGSQIELLVERVKPFFANVSDSDLATQTIAKVARMTGKNEGDVAAAMGKIGYDEAALVHMAFYNDLGAELVDEIIPSIRHGMNVLPKGIIPERMTLIGERTLTTVRRDALAAAVASKDGVVVRAMISKLEDFDFVNEKAIDISKNDDLLALVDGWLKQNGDTALTEIRLRDGSGVIRAELPADLRRWMEEAEGFGYRLALTPEGAPEDLYRITRDAQGRLLNARPWLNFVSEGSEFIRPNKMQRARMSLFRQVRAEKIVWRNRRVFVRNLTKNHGIAPGTAERMFRTILYASSERGIAPRGLRPNEIMEAAKRAINEEAKAGGGMVRITERELTRELLVAFKGDFAQVGVTQAFTGQMKLSLPGAGSNFWGGLSEKVYPMVKFTFSPWFMLQEYIEPYILNRMRGVSTPLRTNSPGFQHALATRNAINQFLRSDMGRDGAMMEMAEYQRMLAGASSEVHARLGSQATKMTEGLWGDIGLRKAAAHALLTKKVFGARLRETFTEIRGPEMWLDLERHYGTTDAGEIAMRWMAENHALRDANGEKITAIADLLNPINVGRETRISRGTGPGVRFHHLAEFLGYRDDVDGEVMIKGLKDAHLAAVRGTDVPTDAFTRERFFREGADAGLNLDFLKHAYDMATGPEVDEFWDGYRKAFTYRTVKGTKAKMQEAAMARALVQVRAATMGISEEQFIKTHFADIPFRDKGSISSAPDVLLEAREGLTKSIQSALTPEHHALLDATPLPSVGSAVRARIGARARMMTGSTLDAEVAAAERSGSRFVAPTAAPVDTTYRVVQDLPQGVGDQNYFQHAAASRPDDLRRMLDEPPPVPDPPGVERIPLSVARRFISEDRESFAKAGQGATHLPDLTDDIAANGIQEPIRLRYDPVKHALMVADGNTRLAAAIRLNLDSVPVRIISDGVQKKHHYKFVGLDTGTPVDAAQGVDVLPSSLGIEVVSRAPLSKGDRKAITDALRKIEDIRDLSKRPRSVYRDEQGRTFVMGNPTPEDLADMAVEWMDEGEGLAAKAWYSDLRQHLNNLFGDSADDVLRAFAVSQASDSPVNGLAMVLRGLEDAFVNGLTEGSRKVPGGRRAFVGARLRPGTTQQLNVENINRAMLGANINREFAAKLNDFLDSVVGNSTRRWTGRVDGVGPVAVDRHTARDVGLYDAKVISRLTRLPTTQFNGGVYTIMDSAENVVMRVKQVGKGADWHLVNEDGQYIDKAGVLSEKPVSATEFAGAPDDWQYEIGSDLINRATKVFNDRAIWGRTDWRPEEVQAVGWMRVQKTVGGQQESPMDMFRLNTQVVASEVSAERGSDWQRFLAATGVLEPWQTREVTRRVNSTVMSKVRDLFGITTVSHDWAGPARWAGGDTTFSAPAVLLSSPESGDDVADILSLTNRQREVWNPKFVSDGKVTTAFRGNPHAYHPVIDIPHPGGVADDVMEADLNRIAEALDAPGATMFKDVNGNLILRIIDKTSEEWPTPFIARQQKGKTAGLVDEADFNAKMSAAYRKAGLDWKDEGGHPFEPEVSYADVYVAGPKFPPGNQSRLGDLLGSEGEITKAMESGDTALSQALNAEAEELIAAERLAWEAHLDDTLASLRGRGRDVDEGAIRSLRDEATTEFDRAIREVGAADNLRSVTRDARLNEQRGNGAILGYTRRLDDNRRIIAGLKNADPVTGLHELTHVFATDLDASARAIVIDARRTIYTEQRGLKQAEIGALRAKIAPRKVAQPGAEMPFREMEKNDRLADVLSAVGRSHQPGDLVPLNSVRLDDLGEPVPDFLKRRYPDLIEGDSIRVPEGGNLPDGFDVGPVQDQYQEWRKSRQGYDQEVAGQARKARARVRMDESWKRDIDAANDEAVQAVRDDTSGVTPPEVEAVTTKWRDRGTKNRALMEKDLHALDQKGYDIGDAEDALGDYEGIERGDYSDIEDYNDARQEAWDEVLDRLDMIESPLDDTMVAARLEVSGFDTKITAPGKPDILIEEEIGKAADGTATAVYRVRSGGDEVFGSWDEAMARYGDEYGLTPGQIRTGQRPSVLREWDNEPPAVPPVEPPTPRMADTEVEVPRSRSTIRRVTNQITALEHDLGSYADEGTEWSARDEEWFVSEFQKWLRTGTPPSPKLEGVFNHFKNWLNSVWNAVKGQAATPGDEASPQMVKLFEGMFAGKPKPSQNYDIDQHVLRMAAKQQLRSAQDEAFTTQYFKMGRSFFERSLNHPFFGMYPYSYMWGKVLPEMFRFLALRPFGVTAPMVTWNALNEVSDGVRLQQQTDPAFKDFIDNNGDLFMTISSLFPALPNEIPVNAPLWMRRISEQGLMNSARAERGEPTKDIDLSTGIIDQAEYIFGPVASAKRGAEALESAGDVFRGVLGMEHPDPVKEAKRQKSLAEQTARAQQELSGYTQP